MVWWLELKACSRLQELKGLNNDRCDRCSVHGRRESQILGTVRTKHSFD